jgi:hypothetical protein
MSEVTPASSLEASTTLSEKEVEVECDTAAEDDTTAATKAGDEINNNNNYDEVFDALLVAPRETLSVIELTDILHELGLNPSDEEVLTLLSSVGLEGMESDITREQFHLLMENEEHDTSLHAATFGHDEEIAAAPETLLRKKSAVENKGGRHSDMYWIDFKKEEWPDFPKGLTVDEQLRIVSFSVPTGGTMRTDFLPPVVSDILLMVDEKGVDKRMPPSKVLASVATRLQTNGAVHLKFRRHVNHDDYTGEYFVTLDAVPDVSAVEDNVVVGPLPVESAAYHHRVRCGDKLLSINDEVVLRMLDTESFQALCDIALARDGSLTLHFEHTEHRAEVHHDVLHPNIHKGFRAIFGGGCCCPKRGDEDEEVEEYSSDAIGSTKSYADAV